MDPVDIKTWKYSFFKDSFSVDQCLSEYTQKSDLETLRKDMKKYGAELQLHMSEILKNETEAIVDLAEYLTNLNSKLDNLSIPISQLHEEIRTLYDLIKSAECSYELMTSELKNNNLKQNHIHLKLGIISSSVYIKTVIQAIETNLLPNLLTLERIVNKYTFQKIYLDELRLMTPDIEKVVKNVESKLVSHLNNCFLAALKNKDENVLLHCLRMYVNLQMQGEAHYTFQKHILEPEFQPLFTEKCLEICGDDLNKIYLEVKKMLDNNVEVINKIVRENSDLSSFNFVLESFWKEFDKQSRKGLPDVTAPGNPELFQKRFTCTFNLLKYIAAKAGNKNLIKEDDSFKSHLKRFNLPVYFEIRFQQIAGCFESDTLNLSLSDITASKNEHSLKFKASVALWHALVSCFHEDVYIDQLADHFIRFSIMLFSRYVGLMEKLLKEITSSEVNKEDADSFIINILTDLFIVQSFVAPNCRNSTDIEKTIFGVVNLNMWNVLVRIFKVNQKAVLKIQNRMKNYIVEVKIADCAFQLQNVTAIPRLYRRTNRSPPKEASSYMIEAVKPILSFNDKFRSSLEQVVNDIVDNIIARITKQYLCLIQEVLMSVCKTEESLRRLKGRPLNTNTDELTHRPSDIMSDETKIREQIKYDVGLFCDKLYPLAMEPTKVLMNLLKKEVCT